jgi:hypothetical protein
MRVAPDSDFPVFLLSFISAAALSLLHFFLAVQKEMKSVFLNDSNWFLELPIK